MWNNIGDFVRWLSNSVINPMVNMMNSVNILGFTFLQWVLGISVTALGVKFLRGFWDTGKSQK